MIHGPYNVKQHNVLLFLLPHTCLEPEQRKRYSGHSTEWTTKGWTNGRQGNEVCFFSRYPRLIAGSI